MTNLDICLPSVNSAERAITLKKHSKKDKKNSFLDFEKRLDLPRLRLATQNKIPLKKGWIKDNWEEWLSKKKLIEKHGEWSIRGGKRIGKKFLSFLDIDIVKENIPLSLQKIYERYTKSLLDYQGCLYVKTKKGYHVYLLTDEILPNELLYHTDKFGKKRIIGSIQSHGKYVVGFDSIDKKLCGKGKWFWHAQDFGEIKRELGKFFVEVGNRERKTKRNSEKSIPTLTKKPANPSSHSILKMVEILRRENVPRLENTVKIFYQNQRGRGYFLLNKYQRTMDLDIGMIRDISIVHGWKHDFFNRLL